MRTGLLLANAARLSALVLAWGLVTSCSANSADNEVSAGGSGGSDGGAAGSGTGGTIMMDSSVGDGELTEAGACVGDSFPGKLAPLDVLVLLDATGSMNGSGDSPAVWPDVTSALLAIIQDQKTEGIGMGLTYLPVPPPAGFKVPGFCKVDADCPGATGPCQAPIFGMIKTCIHACTADTDCGLYGPCIKIPGNPAKQVCNGAQTPGVSCDANDYGAPVIPIETLPANKDALVNAISNKDPDGANTSTQPALEGALKYAHKWAVDHPSHLTHVLFATDGQPISCTYNSIEGAAAAAETAFKDNPSVPTFVLGVGDPGDLNLIANKGGTSTAYMANSSTVASTMVDIFNEIRANGACKFQIPAPQPGKTLNYDAVNVSYTELGTNEIVTVKYVESVGECDPKEGGWYYDDPTKQSPTKILLCPATCEQVKLSEEGVEILLGCKTIPK